MLESESILTMSWQAWLTISIVILIFGLLSTSKIAPDVIFMVGLSIAVVFGVIDASRAFVGFSSSSLITVGVLYVVVEGVKNTGGLSWISKYILGISKGVRWTQLKLMLPVSALSAFLNNTPVVALFIPIVVDWSRKFKIAPSKLLIPLSYASILGGMCTLIGTSTNLIVNGMYQDRYNMSLDFFEITKIGLPVAILGLLFIIIFSKLLPARKAFDDMIENPKEYTFEMQITEQSNMIGKSLSGAGLRRLNGAYLAELIRDDQLIPAVSPDTILHSGDRLIFAGDINSLKDMYNEQDLKPAVNQLFKLDEPRHQRALVEVVVSNTCPIVGKTIREGKFRNIYNAVVVAIGRNGERLSGRLGDIVLKSGDILLVEANAGFIPRQKDSQDFYLIRKIENSSPKRYEKAPVAFAILVGMVLCVTLDLVSMLNSALIAASLMLITGCTNSDSARKSIEWSILITIGAALGIGAALEHSGAALAIANTILNLIGNQPWIALIAIYFLTSFMTEFVTNNASAVMLFPIAVNLSEQLGVSAMPFIICIMIASSASFATPIGYQTNLMVYGPGGYKFTDFLKIGLPLNIFVGIITTLLTPLIWPFI